MRRRGVWKKLSWALGVLLVLAAAAVGMEWQLRRAEAGMAEDWQRLLGGKRFEEAFPRQETNAAARRLARTVRPLGFVLRDPGAEAGRGQPPLLPRAAEQRWREVRPALSDHLRELSSARSRERWPVPPPAVAAYLDEVAGGIGKSRDLLLRGPEPRWYREVAERTPEYRFADSSGLLSLHKVLLAAAFYQLRAGDEAAGEALLEASWRLREATARDPEPITLLVSLATLRWQLAALRELCHPHPVWRGRLRELDLLGPMRLALEADVHYLHGLRQWDGPLEADLLLVLGKRHPPGSCRWLRPVARWGVRDYAVRYHRALARLDGMAPQDLHPGTFCQGLARSIPRWQVASRVAMLCLVEAWSRAFHRQMDAELTELVLETRGQPTEGGIFEDGVPQDGLFEDSLLEDGLSELGLSELGLSEFGLSEFGLLKLGANRPSRSAPGLRWRAWREGGSVRWELEGGLPHSLANEPPLSYTLAPGSCGGS